MPETRSWSVYQPKTIPRTQGTFVRFDHRSSRCNLSLGLSLALSDPLYVQIVRSGSDWGIRPYTGRGEAGVYQVHYRENERAHGAGPAYRNRYAFFTPGPEFLKHFGLRSRARYYLVEENGVWVCAYRQEEETE